MTSTLHISLPYIHTPPPPPHTQVDSHFKQMYVEPSTPEQCSHNAQILVSALRDIGLDYDCQV